MVYGLPSRDEADWDVKLNASIAAVKATADAALPATELDAAATAVDANAASALRVQQDARLSATYVPLSQTASTTQQGIVELATTAETTTGTDTSRAVTPAAASAAFAPKAGPSVNVKHFASVRAAITALAAFSASGGTVLIPNDGTRYYAGDSTYDTNYMSTANIRIVGEKMPRLSANADRLEGGSVIYGRFNAYADGFEATDVGFDMGKYVIDTYYSAVDTHTANHPLGGTWDAFAFAQPNQGTPVAVRRGFKVANVIGLCRDSQSVGHAMLMECMASGSVDNVIGVGGTHAVVVKGTNMRMGRLSGWAASSNNVIFKADSYAACGHLTAEYVESLTVPPGVTPWFTPAVATNGLLLNPQTASFSGPVQIGTVKAFGCTNGLHISGGSAYTVSDVQIDNLLTDTYTGSMTSGLAQDTCNAFRVQIDNLIVNGAAMGIEWHQPTDTAEHQLHIGSAQLSANGARAIWADLYSKITIDKAAIKSTPYAYLIHDAARVRVGYSRESSVTARFESSAPALAANWSNFGGGNATFEVLLQNYGVVVKGLVKAAAGAAAKISDLPAYLRPTENRRLNGYKNDAAAVPIGADSGTGGITLNNGAPATNDYVTLDNLCWQI